MPRPAKPPSPARDGDQRIAVIDIGSNSTRLLIADVAPDGRLDERVRLSGVTRLGSRVDADARLAPDAVERVCRALDHYAELIRRHDCDAALAVLTSAVRDAADGPAFVARVAEDFGLDARMLSGAEEARLTFLGATAHRRTASPDAPTLVIDVGGGSTELVRDAAFHVSLQAGVVRQSERHLHTDPPTPDELRALRRDVRALIERHVPAAERRAPREAIAVAGTATSCASIDQGLDPYDAAKVHGYRVELTTCRLLLARLAGLPLADLRLVKGLHPDRAPTIVAGVAMLVEILEAFDLPGFETSEHDILRGAALDRAGHTGAPARPAPENTGHPSASRPGTDRGAGDADAEDVAITPKPQHAAFPTMANPSQGGDAKPRCHHEGRGGRPGYRRMGGGVA